MSLYYFGDVEKELSEIREVPEAMALQQIAARIGYGRSQQLIQLLWAKELKDRGEPIYSAWGPDGLTADELKARLDKSI